MLLASVIYLIKSGLGVPATLFASDPRRVEVEELLGAGGFRGRVPASGGADDEVGVAA